jgi:hypothetical protein
MRQELSAEGRQEVGTWIANRLAIVCGGISALVLVPAMTGKTVLPPFAVTACGGMVIAIAVLAGLIKYGTAERTGEAARPEDVAHD